jgi:flavin-dependent thymidylate synthase
MLFSRGLKMLRVNLLSYSQAPPYFVDPPEGMKASLLDLIAYCARVSNPENQDNRETSKKLIKYLIKHKHWSPLEMVSACVEVTTTRDIARQALRHRSFSFQEYSQRYANPVEENSFEFVIREARLQDLRTGRIVHRLRTVSLMLTGDGIRKKLSLLLREHTTGPLRMA